VVVWFDRPPWPLWLQVTPSADESFVTAAVNCIFCPWSIACVVAGVNPTPITGFELEPPPPHPLKAIPIPTASTPNSFSLADMALFISVTWWNSRRSSFALSATVLDVGWTHNGVQSRFTAGATRR
jgi:hypothetical protein